MSVALLSPSGFHSVERCCRQVSYKLGLLSLGERVQGGVDLASHAQTGLQRPDAGPFIQLLGGECGRLTDFHDR